MNLDTLNAELRRAGDNLRALADSPVGRRLGHRPKLGGVTEARAAAAMADVRTFRDLHARLTAVAARGPSHLHEASVELTIVSPAALVTPARALQVLGDFLGSARDALSAIGDAWDRLPARLDDLDVRAGAIRQFAASLGEPLSADLEEVRRRAAELRPLAETDPLGSCAACDELAARLDCLRPHLEGVAAERDRAWDDLQSAWLRLREAEDAHARARVVLDEQRLKVRAGEQELPDDSAVAALNPWLARLEDTFREGDWRSARHGYAGWDSAVRTVEHQCRTATTAAEDALRERRDLRGLLDALKAKARALGRAEDPRLSRLAGRADQLLAAHPTHLTEARAAVAEYESLLA
jgi:hypothetical protein